VIQGEAVQALQDAIADHPDATLHEVREATGFEGCLVTLWRKIKRFDITRKKVPAGAGAARPGSRRPAAGSSGAMSDS
jgi:hypothetical protein